MAPGRCRQAHFSPSLEALFWTADSLVITIFFRLNFCFCQFASHYLFSAPVSPMSSSFIPQLLCGVFLHIWHPCSDCSLSYCILYFHKFLIDPVTLLSLQPLLLTSTFSISYPQPLRFCFFSRIFLFTRLHLMGLLVSFFISTLITKSFKEIYSESILISHLPHVQGYVKANWAKKYGMGRQEMLGIFLNNFQNTWTWEIKPTRS